MTWAYIPSTYSQEREEESKQTGSSDIEQSELLRSKSIPERFCLLDSLTEAYLDSLFGTMLKPSESTTQQQSHISDGSRRYQRNSSSAAGSRSRAKISAQPEKAKGSPVNDPGSGWKWRESSVKYDPVSRLWKTRQFSLLEDSEWFSETWPKWGLMRDGESWELPMSARPTRGIGSGLLPTPTANTYGSCQGGSSVREGQKNRPSLNTMAATGLWPTPRTTGLDGGSNSRKAAKAPGRWPTPRSCSAMAATITKEAAQKLADGSAPIIRTKNLESVVTIAGGEAVIGGALNPDWVELLMGWPKGWTSLEPLDSAEMRGWGEGWEDGIPRTAKGIPARADRLKAIGNGQVPQCAAEAWRILK